MIQPVTQIRPLPRIRVQRQDYKFTALPPEISVDKPKKKTWSELLSPWLIIAGCLIVGALYGWLVTIARHI